MEEQVVERKRNQRTGDDRFVTIAQMKDMLSQFAAEITAKPATKQTVEMTPETVAKITFSEASMDAVNSYRFSRAQQRVAEVEALSKMVQQAETPEGRLAAQRLAFRAMLRVR